MSVSENEPEFCKHPDPDVAPHPCPYSQEIKGDDDTLCRCCDWCERECARDI